MVPGAQENPWDARGTETFQEGLVVRHHDRAVGQGEIEERIVRRPGGVDRAIPVRETERGPRMSVSVREDCEFRNDGTRHCDVWVPEEAVQLRLEVHAELERHHEGVRVKKDEPGHQMCPPMPAYMGVW